MNYRHKKEMLLPTENQQEWLEGVRYRVKQLKKAAWDRLQAFESNDQIKAMPVFVFKGNSVDLIQTDIPFLSIKDPIDHFVNAKNKVIKLAHTSARVLKIKCSEILNIRA
jgi:hypothetical protein